MKILKFSAFVVIGALLAGCDDPFELRWEANPVETTLHALDADHVYSPSGFNLFERRRVVIESPTADGRWDFAVEREAGTLVLVPAGVMGTLVNGRLSQAGIAPIPQTSFEDVREAPGDTLQYRTTEPVALELGTVYVIRTHQQGGRFGQRCLYYGKLEPLEIDLERGSVRFLHDVSPACNDRRLVPRGS